MSSPRKRYSVCVLLESQSQNLVDKAYNLKYNTINYSKYSKILFVKN
jgi:hypothetical protein